MEGEGETETERERQRDGIRNSGGNVKGWWRERGREKKRD